MQRLTQANLHKPAEDIFGDCARTCMAMILGLDRDSIPNFGVHYDDNAAWCKAVDDFLRPLGLSEVGIPIQASSWQEAASFIQRLNPGIPFVLGGISLTGVVHAVVISPDGQMYDPSINSSGIVKECEDGYYWVWFYAKWCR